MQSKPNVLLCWVVSLCLSFLMAESAAALSSCKVKVNSKTGTILVSAKEVTGLLTWGSESATSATRAFHNAGTCIAGGKAKGCTLGADGTARAITPPPQCTIYLKDSSGACSVHVKGCTPGDRGLFAKDTNGLVFAYCPGGLTGYCQIVVPDGRLMVLGSMGNSVFPSYGYVYYESTGCTGAPLADAPNGYNNQLAYAEQRGTALYYPSNTAPSAMTYNSYFNESLGCVDSSYTTSLVPALSLDISAFQPPYHLDTMP